MNIKKWGILGCIVTVLLALAWMFTAQQTSTLSRDEVMKKIVLLEKHMKKEKAYIEDDKRDFTKSNTIDTAISNAEQYMLDVQKEALHVGKFICKVNTCQSDPTDENYPVFIDVTDKLVKAKEEVVHLKKIRDKQTCYLADEKELKLLKEEGKPLQKMK